MACVVVLLVEAMSSNPPQRVSLEQVGIDLIEASKRAGDESLPLSTRLFPYILIASRKMSLRRMSAWLQENHGVSLSVAAISRALNQPELHLSRLAETIAPAALYVAKLHEADAMTLLFGTAEGTGASELQYLADRTKPEWEEDIPPLERTSRPPGSLERDSSRGAIALRATFSRVSHR